MAALQQYQRQSGPVVESWEVRDFKALEFAESPLRGLTVLAGANSSGKSSLLQSLQLVAQSADQEVTLNGNLVRLGVPRDVIRNGASVLSLGCTATTRDDEEITTWQIEFALRQKSDGLRVSECHVTRDGRPCLAASDSRVTDRTHTQVDPDRVYGDTMLRVREIDGEGAPAHTYLSFNGLQPIALFPRTDEKSMLSELRRSYSLDGLRGDPIAAETFTELVFSNFYRSQTSDTQDELSEATRAVVSGGLLVEHSHRPPVTRNMIDLLHRALARKDANGAWQQIPISPGLTSGARRPNPRYLPLMIPSFETAFQAASIASAVYGMVGRSVRHVGPLREEPQVVSKSATRSRTSPVGPRGELTADVLSTRTANVAFRDWDNIRRRMSLTSAVSLWSNYLGIGDDVSVEDQGKLGRGIRIKVNGVARDLTMIGVGASQLLPIITTVLDSAAGSIVLLEQPELHLHPSVQSRLGDFLLYARPDLCIIAETHSEYLVTRLRRRVAEERLFGRKIHLLFAEPSESGTEVRELGVTSLGNLSEWPHGFFDAHDSDARAIVKALTDRKIHDAR